MRHLHRPEYLNSYSLYSFLRERSQIRQDMTIVIDGDAEDHDDKGQFASILICFGGCCFVDHESRVVGVSFVINNGHF